jgi:hypothetical protein
VTWPFSWGEDGKILAKCKCPCHSGNAVHIATCACKVCELCGERYVLADIEAHRALCPLLCPDCSHEWTCHKMGSRKPMCLWPSDDFEPFVTQLLVCHCERLKDDGKAKTV